MPYDPAQHHRASIRLKGYDYRQAGAYFVTIVAQGRACLFGDVINNDMILNDAGRMVERWWWQLNDKFPTIVTDAYIVMPNHFHGIIVIVGADPRVRPAPGPDTTAGGHDTTAGGHDTTAGGHDTTAGGHDTTAGGHDTTAGGHDTTAGGHDTTAGGHDTTAGGHDTTAGGHDTTAGGHVGPPLPTIIQWFKTMTTNEYIRGVKQLGWPAFAGKLWQRNYFEHVVRNEQALERIRGYIAGNPQRWPSDEENANRLK